MVNVTVKKNLQTSDCLSLLSAKTLFAFFKERNCRKFVGQKCTSFFIISGQQYLTISNKLTNSKTSISSHFKNGK